jgi:PTH1 family peptidyl-tRNA hydrolase
VTGWVIVGLGNPGPAYAATRHNIGYLVLDELSTRMSGSWRRHRGGRADVVQGRLGRPGAPESSGATLVRPRSFMNESGGAVQSVVAYLSVPHDRVVVVHDELDLDFGTLRVKYGGGDNGHNGLRSLRRSLGTGDWFRVRLGVGRPPGRHDPADHVLSAFSSSERRDLPELVARGADAAESLVLRGLQATQNDYH